MYTRLWQNFIKYRLYILSLSSFLLSEGNGVWYAAEQLFTCKLGENPPTSGGASYRAKGLNPPLPVFAAAPPEFLCKVKLLPPYALILAQNAPKCVWRPGSIRPDPLGELERSPRPPSPNKGAYF